MHTSNTAAPGRKSLSRRVSRGLLLLACTLLAGCPRWELDRQMEALCNKDGGVRVYEQVTMPSAQYQEFFKNIGRSKSKDEYYGPDYRYVSKLEVIVGPGADANRGEGQITRWYQAIYRRSDGKLLGEAVLYSRAGGDVFTFGFQPSGNACPKPRVSLLTSTFVEEKPSGR